MAAGDGPSSTDVGVQEKWRMKKLRWICPRCGGRNRLRYWACRRCRARVAAARRMELALLWVGALR